jgi:hypothetical protein
MKTIVSLALCLLFFNCITGDKSGNTEAIQVTSQATLLYSQNYTVLGEVEGESSCFYFLGMIPMTNPINMDYAMSSAVSKIEGAQSIVDLRVWNEIHIYFPLGRVSVVKVRGKAIRFGEINTK